MKETKSKALNNDDSSAFDFVKECLKGDKTSGINFDRLQYDFKNSRYVIIEYLLCDVKQDSRNINPHTSHPNRYFKKNSMKFISLWDVAQKLEARLYLINYAKAESKHSDKVKIMIVNNVDGNKIPPVETIDYDVTRGQFSIWLRKLNSMGFSG